MCSHINTLPSIKLPSIGKYCIILSNETLYSHMTQFGNMYKSANNKYIDDITII